MVRVQEASTGRRSVLPVSRRVQPSYHRGARREASSGSGRRRQSRRRRRRPCPSPCSAAACACYHHDRSTRPWRRCTRSRSRPARCLRRSHPDTLTVLLTASERNGWVAPSSARDPCNECCGRGAPLERAVEDRKMRILEYSAPPRISFSSMYSMISLRCRRWQWTATQVSIVYPHTPLRGEFTMGINPSPSSHPWPFACSSHTNGLPGS